MISKGEIAKSIRVASVPEKVRLVCEEILASLKEHKFDDNDLFSVHLALEEALTNAVKHGNKLDPSKYVIIDYRITDGQFHIMITDQGPGFRPDAIPDCRQEQYMFSPGGRGLLLMQAYMDFVEYSNNGNTVTMMKHSSNCRSIT